MKKKTFLIVGGDGFLASHIINLLKNKNHNYFFTSRKPKKKLQKNCIYINFSNEKFDKIKFIKVINKIDFIIFLIAKVGGIIYNSKQKYDPTEGVRHLKFIANKIERYKDHNKILKFVFISSACVYPAYIKNVNKLREHDAFLGLPHQSNYDYSLTKRLQEIYMAAFIKIPNVSYLILRPFNFYGPKDDFESINSHVIPSLIKKFYHYTKNKKKIVINGDMEASRNFLYVEDVADLIIKLSLKQKTINTTINLGSEYIYKIKDIIKTLKILFSDIYKDVDYSKIYFDKKEIYNGQKTRSCNTKLLRSFVPNYKFTSLEMGLSKTLKSIKNEK